MKRWKLLKNLGFVGFVVALGMLGGWSVSVDWPEPWQTPVVVVCLVIVSLIARYMARCHGGR